MKRLILAAVLPGFFADNVSACNSQAAQMAASDAAENAATEAANVQIYLAGCDQ